MVVLGPRRQDMINEGFAARPRSVLQIAELEGMIEQLCLVQPRGAGRRQAGMPPTASVGEVIPGDPARMTGTTVMDQIDPPKPAVVPSELLQGRDIVIGIV